MKPALVALVLTVAAPAHLSVTFMGAPVQFPAGWLILAAEVLAAIVLSWLAARILRGFCSSPWPRPVAMAGGAP